MRLLLVSPSKWMYIYLELNTCGEHPELSMYTYEYPRPALTVDIVIFTLRENRLHILLIQRAENPYYGYWALPGGCVRMDESLEEAAIRELAEDTGLREVYLEQLYTYGNPARDPRGRVVAGTCFALIPADAKVRSEGGSDAAQALWFPVNALPDLAFDHADILKYALRRLRYKLEYTAVGFELLPEIFHLLKSNKPTKSFWVKNSTSVTFAGVFCNWALSNQLNT